MTNPFHRLLARVFAPALSQTIDVIVAQELRKALPGLLADMRRRGQI